MPEPFASATRESLKDRQQLLPYRYSAAAVSHASGLCSHRGMHVSASSSRHASPTRAAINSSTMSKLHSHSFPSFPTLTHLMPMRLLASFSSATISLSLPPFPPSKTRQSLPRADLPAAWSACLSGYLPLLNPGLISTRLLLQLFNQAGCCTMRLYSQFLFWLALALSFLSSHAT
jgi:hypothetical protein